MSYVDVYEEYHFGDGEQSPLSPLSSPHKATANTRRRLPTVPAALTRSVSRPLPPIPRPLWCKQCRTCITSINLLLPISAIPSTSRAFRGFSGKASLFTEIHHVNFSRPAVRLMATGAHTMQEITCSKCATYLGWRIVRAHDASEKWKEGNYLLELENLYATTSTSRPGHQRHLLSSDSDDSS